MEARKVPAANAWLWIKQGYWLFKKSPVLWVVLTAMGVAGQIGLAIIPVVGDILATLLLPVFMAGFMAGCRALEMDEELELAHLFAGFKQSTQQLVTLGGITLVCQLLILGVMMITGGSDDHGQGIPFSVALDPLSPQDAGNHAAARGGPRASPQPAPDRAELTGSPSDPSPRPSRSGDALRLACDCPGPSTGHRARRDPRQTAQRDRAP